MERPTGIRLPCIAILILATLLVTRHALAEEISHPLEPADTSSPRATLTSFIDFCNDVYADIRNQKRSVVRKDEELVFHARQIVRCLDLSEQPAYLRDHVGREAAVCLKEVLDRIELPPPHWIPDAAAVRRATPEGDPLRWTVPHTAIAIAKVQQGPRRGEFLFTPDTVERAAEFYERVKDLPYRPGASEGFYNWFLSEPGSATLAAIVHWLPDWAQTRVYGQTVWQWVGLVVVNVGGLLVMLAAYLLGRRQPGAKKNARVLRYWVTLLFPIAAMAVPLVVKNLVVDKLVISGGILVLVEFSTNVVFMLALIAVVFSVGNRIAEAIIASPRIHPQGINAQFIRLVARLACICVAALVFLEGGRYLGIPLTTLLAGAGVGGLTLALAAQDTLKNIFGTMMIFLDKPYRIGERIVVKQYDGEVEEIGLRSTKIRLLTGHVASIPNEEMARTDIENIGRRPYIRRIQNIALAMDTPADKVQAALDIIRELLKDHEGMEPEFPPRVYFNEFGKDSLNVRIIYWYHPPNYWDFLAHSERFNVQLIRQFEAAGIKFDLPTSTTYLAQDGEKPLHLNIAGDTAMVGMPVMK